MSADLFAAFDDPPPPKPNQAQPPKPSPLPASTATDPFSFLGSTLSNTASQQTQPWPSLPQSVANDPWGGLSTGGVQSQPAAKNTLGDDGEDEDGWGDFETAEPASKPAPNVDVPTSQQPPQHPAIQRTRIVRAPTIELMTNNLIDLPGANALPEEVRSPPWMRQSFAQQQTNTQRTNLSEPKPPLKPKPQTKPVKADPNVLFDADEFDGQDVGANDDDDDFGEFETVASPAQPPKDIMSEDLFTPPATAHKPPADMLSGLTLSEPTSSYPRAPRSPSFQERNPFPGLALHTPTEPKAPSSDNPITSPVTAWPTIDQGSAGSNKMEDDWASFDDLPEKPQTVNKQTKATGDNWDWDAFDDQPPATSTKPQPASVAAHDTDSSWAWDSADITGDLPTKEDESKAPPINVPPPSVLLSIFPQLLGQANESLFKPVGGQAFSIKNRILSDPKTIEFLRGYLVLATVAGRVIAGRKQRWHRDKFLSQSMSISAAGSKGMKLAGVDKTQAAREDREAGDILDLWKEHVGRLRSSVAAANSTIKDTSQQLKIPELRENIQIQMAKGVLTAPKACIICGLKRDERLPRIDFSVEDSFGEWWTDHWGHTACKRFWLKHENDLRQR
ncbi:hypothetical protein JX266_000706 [Neoarthrinium moseri]|nr:hypothetical protein JX266_000706 [Neoarthrinium moseri]